MDSPETTTDAAAALGTTVFTANGRVHPHGQYTHWYFEYGPDSYYGRRTAPEPLPARRGAHYAESWDEGCNGWTGDFGCREEHRTDGGPSKGYLRVIGPSVSCDFNHDASGVLHLMTGLQTGPLGERTVQLGGGDGDIRNARVSLYLRGNDWQPNGSEFGFWLQCQSNIERGNAHGWRRANYTYCSYPLTDYLVDGEWHRVEFDLISNSTLWTYGGNNSIQQGPNALRYAYWPIDQCLAHANINMLFLSTLVNPENPPTGSVDFDELEIAYCNQSLIYPGNGGRLISAPESAPDDPAVLTDGWRAGTGHMWRSASNPDSPQAFVYRFESEVLVDTVQIHQHPDWPAKDVEILVSMDGDSFHSIAALELKEYAAGRPGTTFGLRGGLEAQARFLKVELLSGYRDLHWGLGEIEIFGSGGGFPHDNVEQHVSHDIVDLSPGQTYHFRLVAESDSGKSYGERRTFTTPDSQKPLAATGVANRVTATTAKLSGRMNAMGCVSYYYFEYGRTPYEDTPFGNPTVTNVEWKRPLRSSPQAVQMPMPGTFAGLQPTMRTVVDNLEDLEPGATYHYRLVAVNQHGVTCGDDATFTTRRE